jgi:hypothetical protein
MKWRIKEESGLHGKTSFGMLNEASLLVALRHFSFQHQFFKLGAVNKRIDTVSRSSITRDMKMNFAEVMIKWE